MILKMKTVPAHLDISEIGMDIADVIVKSCFCKTKSEARRLIMQGSVKLNDVPVSDRFARLVSVENEFILLEHEQ